jgi:hypothetical protein
MPASRPLILKLCPRRIARPLAAIVALLAPLPALAACGGGSASAGAASSAAAGQRAGGGRGFVRDPMVRACLAKQGITLPARRGGGGARGYRGTPPTGTIPRPPTGADARPPTGTNARPPGGPGRDPAQFAKLRAALKKCGVQPRGGGPGGRPPTRPRAPAKPTATTS